MNVRTDLSGKGGLPPFGGSLCICMERLEWKRWGPALRDPLDRMDDWNVEEAFRHSAEGFGFVGNVGTGSPAASGSFLIAWTAGMWRRPSAARKASA